MSSERSQFCYVNYATDTFKIGFLVKKRADAGNCSECTQFHEGRSTGGDRTSARTLAYRIPIESAEEGGRGN
jgi:hypothetical protein